MSDFLLELGQNPTARQVIKRLGLPIPVPQKLARADGPWEERELEDRVVLYAGGPGAALADAVAATLAPAGATAMVADLAPFAAPGEAWGRPPRLLDESSAGDALVFDASGLASPDDLRALYDFFHPRVAHLARCGRVVVLGRPPGDAASPVEAATRQALDGFVRSVAKEIGKKGATAQTVYVAAGAEERLGPVLRYLLSPRSAYMTGQPLVVAATAAAAPARPATRPLHGKVALVTGAARGIGEATARRLAEEGAHVVVLDRPADDGPASRVARDIGGATLLVDVSEPGAADEIARRLAKDHGGVDVIVHSAGVTRDKTLAKMGEGHWDQAIGINLAASIAITEACAREAGPLRDHGRVVLLSSIAGVAGNFGQTNYAASKAGVIGYARALAAVVAGRGITVNAVAPGFIETRLTAAMPVMTREVARRMAALAQAGQPLDVAELCTFLASPGSDGVTGQVLRICGGNLVGG